MSMAEDERSGACTEDVESSLDSFAELQAILAGLPMHAVPPPVFSRSCGACGEQKQAAPVDGDACIHRVRLALGRVCLDYPDHAGELRHLRVEHASLDLVCFANHKEEQLFTAVRGTDRMLNPLTTPRDWNNDVLILFGMPPCRTSKVIAEYKAVRERFPTYRSYGSGHSLGGNLVEHLALYVQEEPRFCLCRIDVFNTGASPLRQTPNMLTKTELHAHRVPGDWASWYYRPPSRANLHTYKPKMHVSSQHALGHFLPDKASASSASTTGGEDGEQDDEDDDEEEQLYQMRPRRPPAQPCADVSIWTSLLSCAGLRKGSNSRRDCIQAPRPHLGLEDSLLEDRWRNCEAPKKRPTGPVEELQEMAPRRGSECSSQPILRPPARSEDEEDDDDAEASLRNLSLRRRLVRALEATLASGELTQAMATVAASHEAAASASLRPRLATALDDAVASGELAEAVARVEAGIWHARVAASEDEIIYV